MSKVKLFSTATKVRRRVDPVEIKLEQKKRMLTPEELHWFNIRMLNKYQSA